MKDGGGFVCVPSLAVVAVVALGARPLLCSILRHPEVLLGRDALPEAALLVLMHPQGKGRDEDTDVVPELTEKKKIRWNTRLLLQFLLKWETRSV